MLKVKKKSVFFLFGIVYLKKGLMFVLLINHKIINTMKNTIQISLSILILLIFAYGALANFHPLSLGILGALNIYSFAITYVSLTNK